MDQHDARANLELHFAEERNGTIPDYREARSRRVPRAQRRTGFLREQSRARCRVCGYLPLRGALDTESDDANAARLHRVRLWRRDLLAKHGVGASRRAADEEATQRLSGCLGYARGLRRSWARHLTGDTARVG